MKANELMIGDWVRFLDDQDCFTDNKVEGIDELGNILVSGLPDEEYNIVEEPVWTAAECFEPIPLTPEILEKNGFKEYNGYGYAGNKGYYLKGFYINHDFSIRIANINCKVNFIHELQHALKLCGIEKTIEL